MNRISVTSLAVWLVAAALADQGAAAAQGGAAQGGAATKSVAQPAQPASPTSAPTKGASSTPVAAVGVTVPSGYVIGPEDVLSVVVWREADMSGEAIVRPDGMITLPLLHEVKAAGLTPEQLRQQVTAVYAKYVEEPDVNVVVKAINSRKVYITGQVNKPGPYPLGAPITVMQLIATAGGVLEYADSENIVILRQENGKEVSHRFNYKEVAKRKKLTQNIELKPGDTIIVP